MALRQKETKGRRLQGRDRQVEVERLALQLDPGDGAILVGSQALDRRVGPRLDSQLSRSCDHRVDQALVAADDVAHFLPPALAASAGHAPGAGPEVGRGQAGGITVEARVEQWLPDPLVDLLAAVAAQPGLQRNLSSLS